MKGPFIVEVRISTFRGISIGAEHWYGRIRVRTKADRHGIVRGGYGAWEHPQDDHDLKRVLDEPEAASLRAKDGDTHWPLAGHETGRFNARDEVLAAGLAYFAEHFSLDDLLVQDAPRTHGAYIALGGSRAEEFNAVPEREQFKWLHDNGYTQDKDWVHG